VFSSCLNSARTPDEALRLAWLCYLDPFALSGGGELASRCLIEAGRRRGHQISIAPWLRGRPQRAARRYGLHRRVAVDWEADLFVLADIRNNGPRTDLYPDSIVDRALSTGRAIILANAWVDVCNLDLPCDGDTRRCPLACSRQHGNRLYGAAMGAAFVSPRQHQLTARALDVELPEKIIYARPNVDPTVFRPLALERDIDVLYVGWINRAKGYYNLIARFGAERMTFAGGNALGHAVAGRYLGRVDQRDLPSLYNRARIFAHLPAWNEPMGRTVVEAALCGCELVLNGRVGVTSYDAAEWRDPRVIMRNPDRFWQDFESAFADAGPRASAKRHPS
jgi:glycosyltransferase involved in cell wall biosynthesis